MEMDKEQYGKAKARLVSCMQEGQSWQRASASAGLQISQSNAYRLMNAVRQLGEAALSDGRHGHPSKLRGAARAFLAEQCRQAPQRPSSAIQALLRERFGLSVSISQINRVRATLDISNRRKSQQQEKKLGWQTWEAEALLQSREIGIGVAAKAELAPTRFLAIFSLLAQRSPGCHICDL